MAYVGVITDCRTSLSPVSIITVIIVCCTLQQQLSDWSPPLPSWTSLPPLPSPSYLVCCTISSCVFRARIQPSARYNHCHPSSSSCHPRHPDNSVVLVEVICHATKHQARTLARPRPRSASESPSKRSRAASPATVHARGPASDSEITTRRTHSRRPSRDNAATILQVRVAFSFAYHFCFGPGIYYFTTLHFCNVLQYVHYIFLFTARL